MNPRILPSSIEIFQSITLSLLHPKATMKYDKHNLVLIAKTTPNNSCDLRAHLIFPSPTILTFLPMGWKILIWQILTSFLPIVV